MKRSTQDQKGSVHITHSAFTESGGAERVILNQALELRKRGYRVTCFASSIDRKNCHPSLTTQANLLPYIVNSPLPKMRLTTMLSSSVLLAPLITNRLGRADVVLAHHEPGPWVAYHSWRKYRIPYVCYVHHPPRFIYPRPVEKLLGWGLEPDRRVIGAFGKAFRFIKTIDLVSIRHASVVLTNSARTANEIRRIYSLTPIICPPGVATLNDGRNSALNPNYTIGKISEKTNMLLTVNRHTPQKRLDWLLEIFARIKKKNSQTSLVIVGGSHPVVTPRLIRLAKMLGIAGDVHFAVNPNDKILDAYYRAASVFLYTPPNEDFGIGPIEAMAYGVPVVTWNDDGGPADTVLDNKTGFRASPYSLADFADKTEKILSDPSLREKLSATAVEYVTANFSWARHMNILEGALVQAANKAMISKK